MKEANIAPMFACLYPGLCDKARALGYALAIHGSVITDLDLIAVPWRDDAAEPILLKNSLLDLMQACEYSDMVERLRPEEPTEKPHGRLSWNLYIGFGNKVDLSIMPKLKI